MTSGQDDTRTEQVGRFVLPSARRPPRAISTASTLVPGLGADIGWVLMNAREHAVVPVLRTAAGFARAGASPVHRAQVGRWESGETAPSYELVRRYEEVLGLPEGQLLRAIDFLGRERQTVSAVPVLPAPASDSWLDDTDALLDRALLGGPMSGTDWDAVSAMLGTHPDTLLRRADWAALLLRCSKESGVHVGLEFAHRHEALIRLAGHPRSGEVVVDLAREVLNDPSSQIFGGAVDLLQHTHEPVGIPLLLTQLEDPPAEAPLWTSLYTLTTLVQAGRVTPSDRVRAGRGALELLRQDQPIRVQRAAADLLRAVDPPTRLRIVSALRADARLRIATILAEGGARIDSEAAVLAGRIAERLNDVLGPHSRWAPQLQMLVARATTLTHDEARGNALAVLMLSPQGVVVGEAYAAELVRALESGQHVLADDALSVLSWLAQPGDIPALLRIVVDPATPPVPSMQAAIAVGNCRPDAVVSRWRSEPDRRVVPTRDEVARRVRSSALAQILAPGPDPRSTARGHCYILGMYGRRDILLEVAAASHDYAAIEWCRAARWWLDLPTWAQPAP
ncbi:MAG: helix-turn-helix transcriptional regulator [Lapillicoccus sp.]